MGSLASTVSTTQDLRTAVEGQVGTLVSPEAVVSAPGSASAKAAPFSSVQQEVNLTGFGASDVQMLLEPIFNQASQERETLGGLATSLMTSQAKTTEAQQKMIEAAKTPEYSQTQALIPVLIIGLVLFVLVGGKL